MDGARMERIIAITLTVVFCLYAAAYAQIKDFGIRGNVMDIQEEDMLDVIAKKAGDINKTMLMKQFKGAQEDSMKVNLHLPRCENNASRALVPTYTLKQDIVMPDGTVTYRRGYKFNPLSKLHFSGPVAFFDGNDSAQTNFFLSKNVGYLFATAGNLKELGRHGHHIDPATKAMVERFELRCVPTVYIQKGETFTVVEINPDQLAVSKDGKKR